MNIEQLVMAGLDPAIHAIEPEEFVDHRVKPGDDGCERWRSRA
jgi:hypothetical protein